MNNIQGLHHITLVCSNAQQLENNQVAIAQQLQPVILPQLKKS